MWVLDSEFVEEGCAGVGIVSGVAVNEGLTAVDSAIGAS